jgi:hypothetical protein
MKFYKFVARPTLIYGSETWVTSLEAAEMRLLRSAKGYTRLDKKRTRDPWNTRPKKQMQTEPDQPSRKNGQHQTAETRPQLRVQT